MRSLLCVILIAVLSHFSVSGSQYPSGYKCEYNPYFYATGILPTRNDTIISDITSQICPSLEVDSRTCCEAGPSFDDEARKMLVGAHEGIQFSIDVIHLLFSTSNEMKSALQMMNHDKRKRCKYPSQFAIDGYRDSIRVHYETEIQGWFTERILASVFDVWKGHIVFVRQIGDALLELYHASLCQSCVAPARLYTPTPRWAYSSLQEFWRSGVISVQKEEIGHVSQLLMSPEMLVILKEMREGVRGHNDSEILGFATSLVRDCLPYPEKRPSVESQLIPDVAALISEYVDSTILGSSLDEEEMHRRMAPFAQAALRFMQLMAVESQYIIEINGGDANELRRAMWAFREECSDEIVMALYALATGDPYWKDYLETCDNPFRPKFEPYSQSSGVQQYRGTHSPRSELEYLLWGSPLGTDLYLTAQSPKEPPGGGIISGILLIGDSYPFFLPKYIEKGGEGYDEALPFSSDPLKSTYKRRAIQSPYDPSGTIGHSICASIILLAVVLLM